MISKPYQVNDLILQDIRTVDKPPDWLNPNLGTVIFFENQILEVLYPTLP